MSKQPTPIVDQPKHPNGAGYLNTLPQIFQLGLKALLYAFPLMAGAAGWGLNQINDHETRLTVVESDHATIADAVSRVGRIPVIEERIAQSTERLDQQLGTLSGTISDLKDEIRELRKTRSP